MQFLPLDRVRLGDGPFRAAVQTDLDYALALDVDRLLAPFLREAGLPAVAVSYGNWESSGLDGHIAGHLLSALALLWRATGEPETRRRAEHIVTELARAQRAHGTGYLGGVPGGAVLFESLRHRGRAAAQSLSGGSHWVPWYNLHKTFQGLMDAHVLLGDEQALEVVVRLGAWWLDVARTIDDDTFEIMLDTEYGGMNEAFAELALLTGRDDFAAMARRFSHRRILDPLRAHRDALTGLHANTQIPKAVGYAATADVTDDDALRDAAHFFWRTVVEHRTVAIGGNSVREHLHDAADFTPMIDDREGPEFCNTSNMLRLTRRLAEHELQPEHLEFAERALFNHVLGSQHPTGGFVYFTSMRPRHYRVYSQPYEGFWCCVGTGLEAQARYGEWVFGIEDGALAVNLYTPAEAQVDALAAHVRVEAALPDSGEVRITVEGEARFPLRLRVPAWAGELTDLRVDGEPADGARLPGAVVLDRTWHPGSTVTFRLLVPVRAERLPDGSPWHAYLAGPVVLAARAGTERLDGLRADDSRMGHIAHGPLLPLADTPIVSAGTAAHRRRDGRYEVDAAGRTLVLEPFAGIHDERYTVYWPVADDDPASRRAELERLDDGLGLDEATIDAVAFGEQQPESDHGFRGTATSVMTVGDRRWRVTSGALEVRLAVAGARVLRVRYRQATAPTAVIVRLDDEVVATERLDAGEQSLEVDYGIPAGIAGGALSFTAADDLSTPGIGMVRALR